MSRCTGIFLTLMLISCDRSLSTSEQLDMFLVEVAPQSIEAIDAVLYLNETGCLTCNRAYATLISNYAGAPNVLLVIEGYGTKVDLTPFMGDHSNVILDRNGLYKASLPWKSTSAIFRSKQQVDTVITLEAQTLLDQLNFITERLEDMNDPRGLGN